MLKNLIAAFFLLAIFININATPSFSEDTISVKAEGMALKSADAAEVKRKAIDDALKNAVIDALKAVIKKEGLGAEADQYVLASPPGSYVLNYKILSEGWITHMDSTPPVSDTLQEGATGAAGIEVFHIWIDASVDASRLRSALGNVTGEGALMVTLSLLDIPDYPTFRSIKSALERIAVLKDVSYGSFARGRIVLTAQSSVDVGTLSERISKELESGYAAAPSGDEGVIIRPVPKEIGRK